MKYIYQGIQGLEGSGNSFGTVLTIGEKGPKGNPTNTHQFFIKKPQAVTKQLGSRKGLVRENDPEFVQFNKSDRPELRSVMRFTIVHAVHMREGWNSMVDAFQFQLFAQTLPKPHPSHPKAAPACSGDGVNAQRWDGEEYKDISCPNRLCEFQGGRPSPCKPKAQLSFQLRWPEHEAWSVLPTPSCLFRTHSWHNINKVIIPFFKDLHKQAMALGFHDYNLYGLPCRMTLHKRNVAKGGIVPAISLSTEFEPGKNFRDFLMQSAQMRGNFSAPSLLEQDPHTGEDLL
jgi:hypothetical protein